MRYILILFCLVSIIACQKSTFGSFDEAKYGYQYFPLRVGMERIYQVDSFTFDAINDRPVIDSSSSFIRELFVEKYENSLGEEVYRIERYNAGYPTGPWVIKDVVTEQIEVEKAVRVENNLRFTPLVFPIRLEKNWEGNLYIEPHYSIFVNGELLEDVYLEWNYQISGVDSIAQISGIDFEQLVVTEVNEENAVTLRREVASYAPEIGLVYKKSWILNSICKHELSGNTEFCQDKSWEEKASRGYIVEFRLVSYQ